MSLSKQLKQWRERLKISQAEASSKLGVPVRTYQQWEQGRQSPRGLALTVIVEKIGNSPTTR
jgi:DNA-binding transcriptional regulator YiaG